jgi:hypothetical protein
MLDPLTMQGVSFEHGFCPEITPDRNKQTYPRMSEADGWTGSQRSVSIHDLAHTVK